MDAKSRLLLLLHSIIQEMRETRSEISIYSKYDSWNGFADKLEELRNELLKNKKTAKVKLKFIFLPTSDWDDSGGISGFNPDEILELLDKIK
ncbi:MAG: hypothetical protein OEZ01_09820 [Candidatus Heimdallarchaeota archaeon]|nr:hypothetical protein [Candidatus Heimdallarchaeota archaeon]MDH5646294.1 hypothetical protein [Candidatus Heimdallarchaeota archaeon]